MSGYKKTGNRGLFDEQDKGQDLFADSAYTGEKQEEIIGMYEMNNLVHEKGCRNKPLTEDQKSSNRKKSRTRARVEHVFGFMEQSMKGLYLKSVGIKRAEGIIGLINLTYNLFRYEQVVRLKSPVIKSQLVSWLRKRHVFLHEI